ncbi:VC0807 family protein [Oceanispirochaeta sp.]|jgi:hypothetical protein|uniref:VC0807 family protein n=1 Tax=Oceanispirochaeta sp. TaxID=2035350 RepID=UPI00261FA5EA|nr:VC0807 family protein [Oceanispirochaeta sp.]MDA3955168.1 hypothetical protein [Oceanispirochaeta sp.]
MEKKDEHPLVNLSLNIIIPSFILIKLSTEQTLGPVWGLITALAFPLSYGLFEIIRHRKVNFFSLIGLVSITLTGTLGLLSLDAKWIALKEGGIPFLIGMIVLISHKTPYPIVGKILFSDQIFNIPEILKRLEETERMKAFEKRIFISTLMLSCSFFLSSFLNTFLAITMLVSPPGTTAFNAELGRMTAYSFPVIAVPSVIILVCVFLYLTRSITSLTDLSFSEMLSEKIAPE